MDFEDDHKCILCFDILFYPVLLPCTHKFCKLCLDRHINSNTFSCPLCRTRLSNWLRQLKNKNSNIVDTKLWDIIQKKYPRQIESKRRSENNSQPLSDSASSEDQSEAVVYRQVHKDVTDTLRKTEEDWKGWPSPCVTTCRDVILRILSDKQQPPQIQRRLSRPGEINEEYKRFMEEQENLKRKTEEAQFKMSEALIKIIEEEERLEIEEQQKQKEAQLKIDEELAKKYSEEEGSNPANLEAKDISISSGKLKASITPKRRRFIKKKISEEDDTDTSSYKDNEEFEREVYGRLEGPVFLGPVSTPKTVPNPPQRRRPRFASSSPISLGRPSTSKMDIFRKHFSSSPSGDKETNWSSQKEPVQNSPPRPFGPQLEDNVSSTTISNKELSHFATVDPDPCTSDVRVREKQVSQSRCSSGADSIGQELHHFKPIRSSPTTPPKDGCEWVPQVVVAQRGTVSNEVVRALSNSDLNLSTEEIEESVKYHKQLEADLELAMQIQKEWDVQEKKKRSLERSDYNLRKRKKSNLRKKVLLDRTQATLDSMLIK